MDEQRGIPNGNEDKFAKTVIAIFLPSACISGNFIESWNRKYHK